MNSGIVKSQYPVVVLIQINNMNMNHERWTSNMHTYIVRYRLDFYLTFFFLLFHFQFERFDAHSLNSRQTVYNRALSLNMIINSLHFSPVLYSEYSTPKNIHERECMYSMFVHTVIIMHRRNNNNFVPMKLKVVRANHSVCHQISCQAAKYTTNSRNSIQTSLKWIRNNVSMMMKKKRRNATGNDDT